MSYHDQHAEWCKKHPDATEKEKQAWYDGYHTSTENWVQRKR